MPNGRKDEAFVHKDLAGVLMVSIYSERLSIVSLTSSQPVKKACLGNNADQATDYLEYNKYIVHGVRQICPQYFLQCADASGVLYMYEDKADIIDVVVSRPSPR